MRWRYQNIIRSVCRIARLIVFKAGFQIWNPVFYGYVSIYNREEKKRWLSLVGVKIGFDVLPISSCHVETVALLTRKAR